MKAMTNRYPGYDVLRKRNSVYWNDQTRTVIDRRLTIDPDKHQFFTDVEWSTLRALCDRIVPQTVARPRPVPLAAMVEEKMRSDSGDGYRYAELPPMRDAWRRGLAALDAEARSRHGSRFHELGPLEQDNILKAVQDEVQDPAWRDLSAKSFFTKRVLHDIVSAYYAHPTSWNEIGFGGPASPRGYVRMNFDRRDPWEAAEAKPGRELEARRENARVR
jgi:Gluconate 2-dehydrogenase subunit 3